MCALSPGKCTKDSGVRNLQVVSHAPYSTDSAPSNFWLFPTMKDILRRSKFTSRAAIASAIFRKQTPTEAFAAAMESWRRRCEKCVRLQGVYVEK
jgi:histone-lysine N-methyltransferase SETMAR